MSQELLQALENSPVEAIEPSGNMADQVLCSVLREQAFRISWGDTSGTTNHVTEEIEDPVLQSSAAMLAELESNWPTDSNNSGRKISEIVETYICLKIMSNLGLLKPQKGEGKLKNQKGIGAVEDIFIGNQRGEVLSKILDILEARMQNGGPIAELVKQEIHEAPSKVA